MSAGFVFAALTLAVLAAAPARGEDFSWQRHVALVTVTKQPVNLEMPWSRKEVTVEHHVGTYLGDGAFLISAAAVTDATLLELTPTGSAARVPLALSFVDHEAGLALVRADRAAELGKLEAVDLGDGLPAGGSVRVAAVTGSRSVDTVPGRLGDPVVRAAPPASYELLMYAVQVKDGAVGNSEPLFAGDELAGLAVDADEHAVYAVPAPTIRHVLADHAAAVYRGFPALGAETAPLVSPHTRALLEARQAEGGVRVVKVDGHGPSAAALREGDVLTAIDGQTIDEFGQIEDPDMGAVDYRAVLNRHFGGDRVALQLLRDGAVARVDVTLPRFDSNALLIPSYRKTAAEPYLVVGGFVFQELTLPFLRTWGADWVNDAPVTFVKLARLENRLQRDPAERLIILNRVLADAVNHGYEGMTYRIVDEVDGRSVHSLADLTDALARPLVRAGRKYARIRFREQGGEVIVGLDGLGKANDRIARTYGLGAGGRFFGSPAL